MHGRLPPFISRSRWFVSSALLGCVLGGAAPVGASAQANSADTVVTTPQDSYRAGALRRWVLGDGYRELWETPVRAELLDLSTFGGGLEVLRRGGGQQTSSLRMRGNDGVTYTFRSIDKDARRGLDPLLRESFVGWAQQDQISAILPLGALVVAPLLAAANVLHADPRLVVMPDDARLGEFREEFAGLLGFIEERPDEGPDGEPGFAGSTRVVGSDRLLERLEETPGNIVNPMAFLRARLVDAFVGDWDRHPDQWRWAGFEVDGGLEFLPIPRDRDWALTRLDGLLPGLYRFVLPHYIGFDIGYPPAFNLTWSGRALDRRILPILTWSQWEVVATDLQRSLTDGVLDDAVGRLPESYADQIGTELRVALGNRRDDLVLFARDFYELLAGWVDVTATDEDEVAEIEVATGGAVRVRLFARDQGGDPVGDARFDRTFTDTETEEIRVFLKGGRDRATVQGSGNTAMKIRIVGGGNDDVLSNSSTGGAWVAFYDDRGDNTFETGGSTKVDESPSTMPTELDNYGAPPRDWGHRWIKYPIVSVGSELGAYVEFDAVRSGYGFRQFPLENRFALTAGIGTGTTRPRVVATFTFPLGGTRTTLTAQYEGAERNRFFGFGNESSFGSVSIADVDADSARVGRDQMLFAAEFAWELAERVDFSLGPFIERFDHHGNSGRLIAEVDPLGFSDFTQLGFRSGFSVSGGDESAYPLRGVRLDAMGTWVPPALDVQSAYGSIAGSLVTYITATGAPMQPTLALRVAGERVWGDYPYVGAAFLGGDSSLRGFLHDRFAGDASLFGSAELRLRLADTRFILPGQFGIFGLTDVGRVWLDGEDSSKWHFGGGGGVWMSFLKQHTPTISVSVATSSESTKIYAGLGFAY